MISTLQAQQIKTVTISSEILDQEREILVFTPAGYDEMVHAYYNVVYVFDAQNQSFFDYVHALVPFIMEGQEPFIVVGIKAFYQEGVDYVRNNDFLPELTTERSLERYGPYHGNIDNFLAYVQSEVIPYIDQHYRTLPIKTGIGHSLGGAFVLYAMTQALNIFNNYIAVSPNLAYEEELLANRLLSFDYNRLTAPAFVYLSSADEGDYWPYWAPARERVHAFFRSSFDYPQHQVVVEEYPKKTHLSNYPISVESALLAYFSEAYGAQQQILSDDQQEVVIRATVLNATDELYITGNQDALGNWDPGKIRMQKVDDNLREIRLSLHSPATFKFTGGSWETEVQVQSSYGTNLTIIPNAGEVYEFRIVQE
ncbi:MAG: alpha/beta hydrolase-fold protein [Bacteroidota bacterium]